MSMFEISRRRTLKTSAALLASSVAGCATPFSSHIPSKPRGTFVLVHGSWHGGWCYSRVADLLQRKGHKVYSVTLSGLGERSHLLSRSIRLQTHIDDVVNIVKWEDLNDVVLVAHSYGGMVATGAAEIIGNRLNSLVYLDAFIPKSGESLFDASAPESRDRMASLAAQNGGVYINPFPAKVFNVNPADQAWVDAKCTPHPFATFRDSLQLTGAYEKVTRKTFVRSAYPNAAFDANAERLRQRPDWRVMRIDCGHDIMIDEPGKTTQILEQAWY